MREPPHCSSWPLAIALTVTLCAMPQSASAQNAADYFEANCTACHTIGEGELNGPDLKNVTRVRDLGWLHQFISNPEARVKAGDPIAVELLHKYEDALMPTPEGLTPQLLDELILYLDRQSGGGASQSEVVEPPFTTVDVAAGAALFTGHSRLSGGGVACHACHAAGPISSLGGGRLGPDLTFAFTRLKGRRATTAWLKAPPTPVMRRIFQDRPLADTEVHGLVAFLDHANTTQPQRERRISPTFVVSGFVGAMLGLVVFDWTWKGRLARRGHS